MFVSVLSGWIFGIWWITWGCDGKHNQTGTQTACLHNFRIHFMETFATVKADTRIKSVRRLVLRIHLNITNYPTSSLQCLHNTYSKGFLILLKSTHIYHRQKGLECQCTRKRGRSGVLVDFAFFPHRVDHSDQGGSWDQSHCCGWKKQHLQDHWNNDVYYGMP